MRISGVTPSRTVGWNSGPSALPPVITVAPLATASSTSSPTRLTAALLMSGPIIVSSSCGSPTFIAAAFSASLVANSSHTERSIDDPLGRHADLARVHERAEVRRGDGAVDVGVGQDHQRRLAAELEQHALEVRGRVLGAISLPTLVEPVKLIRRTAGCVMSSSTTSAASAGALVIRLTTPFGMPASTSACTIAPCVRGHSSDALRTTVLP